MTKRISALAALFCLILSLAACGAQQGGTATPMSEEEYLAEVEKASTAIGEVMTSLTGLSATDEDSYRAAIETVRGLTDSFRGLAAISNPPESYADAHKKIAEGCTLFADTLDSLCDDAIKVLDGDLSEEEYSASLTENMDSLTEAGNLLTEGFGRIGLSSNPELSQLHNMHRARDHPIVGWSRALCCKKAG